jgi:hypothetical protein
MIGTSASAKVTAILALVSRFNHEMSRPTRWIVSGIAIAKPPLDCSI